MILSSPIPVLLRYWLVQGVIYMNWVERLHRFSLEALLVLSLVWLFGLVGGGGGVWVAAFLTAHTLSAIFNGHPFAVLVHDAGVRGVCFYRDRDRFFRYVEGMQTRLVRDRPTSLAGALVFGSIVRGIFRSTSDLDARYIAMPGFWNAFRVAHRVFLERLRAALNGFPMDIYMFRDARETAAKMNVSKEPPLVLYSHGSRTMESFGGAVSLGQVKSMLAQNVTQAEEIKPPRAIVVSSGGGHLAEALLAIEGVPLRATIVTLRLPHTEKTLQGVGWKRDYLINPHGDPLKYLLNAWQSFWLVVKHRPELVISTGAGMVIPTCLIAKVLGARLVFIETAARVNTPSRTGKFLYRFADEFYVQWEPLLKVYPKARHGGVLL
ncbi:PssD/Cps14F family polysaccharide biosynthesis glycosyltransferase [Sulfuricaulis limicola]|uniref:PssD/Cps14F family polysaccharide biosynthesis glycosyltransferase n=1 Tax=Sulfuricaulis limicola TaxID=1620215 RepID=UPI000BBAE389|nr:PssD/Cps14F family polysaccharide biosynthesis glycosyltransferase [Sulfuricaulis limicola]